MHACSSFVSAGTPDGALDVGAPFVAAAVAGLWRPGLSMFVHGAMAWDAPYVGWRSEYGGTLMGWPEEVAQVCVCVMLCE